MLSLVLKEAIKDNNTDYDHKPGTYWQTSTGWGAINSKGEEEYFYDYDVNDPQISAKNWATGQTSGTAISQQRPKQQSFLSKAISKFKRPKLQFEQENENVLYSFGEILKEIGR